MDPRANFAQSLVDVAPDPAISGTELTVTTYEGALFPAAPFNATIWPAGTVPTAANAEIVRVTDVAGDVLTIERAQEGTAAIAIVAGMNIAQTITKKFADDIELSLPTSGNGSPEGVVDGNKGRQYWREDDDSHWIKKTAAGNLEGWFEFISAPGA